MSKRASLSEEQLAQSTYSVVPPEEQPLGRVRTQILPESMRTTVRVSVFAVLALVLSVITFSFLRVTGTGEYCAQLSEASQQPQVLSSLWTDIQSVLRSEETMAMVAGPGVQHVSEMEHDLGIDWELLGIPLEHATIVLKRNDGKFYSTDHDAIDEISLGIGQRAHLVFVIQDTRRERSDVPNQSSVPKTYRRVRVECR